MYVNSIRQFEFRAVAPTAPSNAPDIDAICNALRCMSGDNPVNALADDRVTFARAFFEAPVQDFYVSARVSNQSGLLQRVGAQRHR